MAVVNNVTLPILFVKAKSSCYKYQTLQREQVICSIIMTAELVATVVEQDYRDFFDVLCVLLPTLDHAQHSMFMLEKKCVGE